MQIVEEAGFGQGDGGLWWLKVVGFRPLNPGDLEYNE